MLHLQEAWTVWLLLDRVASEMVGVLVGRRRWPKACARFRVGWRMESESDPCQLLLTESRWVSHTGHKQAMMVPPKIQVQNNHILAQNLYHDYLLPKSKVPNHYWVLGPSGTMLSTYL